MMDISEDPGALKPEIPEFFSTSGFDSHHSWNPSPETARGIQRDMSVRVKLEARDIRAFRRITGVDVRYQGDTAYAAAVTLSYPQLKVVETRKAKSRIAYPYISGLLAFREIPALIPVLEKLTQVPDVILADGHGTAHPRRFGLACHLGVLLDMPVIGCAKKRLWGSHGPTGNPPGDITWIEDQGQRVGAVLRTRRRVSPVFVSPGHRIELCAALDLVKFCVQGYRIPEPLRLAGILSR